MSDLSGFAPRARPTRRIFEGRFVRLEPLDPAAHGDALFEAGAAPGAEGRFRYLSERPLVRRADFDSWIAKAAADENQLFYAVVDQGTNRAEGRLCFMRIEAAHGVIETGSIMFGPNLARTAGASEAIYLQGRHVFDDLGYRRFEWKCNDRNEPSKRAALRLGFTYEGLFRQHMVVKGESRDTAWFAMLDGEWPARRSAFERFLDPDNFTADGRQRLSLTALNAAALPLADAGDLRLRRALLADRARLVTLQTKAYTPNRPILGVEPLPLIADYGEILHTHETWLAEDGRGLVGALILEPRPDHCLIWSVAVAPGAQRSGLGTKLLAAAETRARTLGVRTLRLYTGEKLTQNIRWYHRHGYAIDRTEERADRRVVHMVKTID